MTRHRLFIIICILAFCAEPAAVLGQPVADSIKEYRRIGRRALLTKKIDVAQLNFEKILQLDPNDYEALSSLGVVHSSYGRNELALDYFLKAYRIDSTEGDLLNNIGSMYTNLGEPERAVQFLEKAVAADPVEALYQTNLGMAYLQVGRLDNALAAFRQADSLDPGRAVVHYSLGNTFSAMKVWDSAIYYYEMLESGGMEQAELHYFLGLAYRNTSQLKKARDEFEKALKLRPNYRDCAQTLGLLYLYGGSYADATPCFETVVGSDSSFYPGWIGLGVCRAMTRNFDGADSILQILYGVDSSLAFQMLDMIDSEAQKRKSEIDRDAGQPSDD